MKKRLPSNFMCKESFAHLYLSLRLYEDIYEDGYAEADAFLQILVQVFSEEHKEVLDSDNAYSILSEEYNSRNAGRKPKLSDDDKEDIRQMKLNGKSIEEIASKYKISRRSVYYVCRS